MEEECAQCAKQGNKVLWKKVDTHCGQCGKRVKRILDLHHTNRQLCSLECEAEYWLDIIY